MSLHRIQTVATPSTNLTLTPADGITSVYATTGGGGIDVNLPADPSLLDSEVWVVFITKIDVGVGVLTIGRNGNNINGVAADYTISTQDDFVVVKTDGSNYFLSSLGRHDALVAGTIASHDTTATGAQLTSLTDNSITNTLHRHSELVASDGSPDPALSVAADGEVTFAGFFALTTGMYNDWNFPVSTLSRGAGSNPDIVDLASTDIEVAVFDGASTMEEVSGVIELNHNYQEGTDITPHIHWYPTTADAGSVRWQLEYTILGHSDTASTSTTIYIDSATNSSAWEQLLANFPAISGTGLVIGDQLHFRLFRDPTDNDSYTEDAAAATLGFHYKADTLGSRQISTK